MKKLSTATDIHPIRLPLLSTFPTTILLVHIIIHPFSPFKFLLLIYNHNHHHHHAHDSFSLFLIISFSSIPNFNLVPPSSGLQFNFNYYLFHITYNLEKLVLSVFTLLSSSLTTVTTLYHEPWNNYFQFIYLFLSSLSNFFFSLFSSFFCCTLLDTKFSLMMMLIIIIILSRIFFCFTWVVKLIMKNFWSQLLSIVELVESKVKNEKQNNFSSRNESK